MKFEIRYFSEFLTNLVIHFKKISEFSPFNKILLTLFIVSNAFHNSILNFLHRSTHFSFNVTSNIITKCVLNVK